MWEVFEERGVAKILERAPTHIAEKYDFWVNVVRLQGPHALKDLKGFHDEALKGEWKGFRSSRLSLQYRIVYRVIQEALEVHVQRVTAHDYRRK